MRNRISKLEDDIKLMRTYCGVTHEKIDREFETREARWVTKDTFNAVINPMAHALEELQRDVKKILTLVSKHSN